MLHTYFVLDLASIPLLTPFFHTFIDITESKEVKFAVPAAYYNYRYIYRDRVTL